jgi:hypothetical protein
MLRATPQHLFVLHSPPRFVHPTIDRVRAVSIR